MVLDKPSGKAERMVMDSLQSQAAKPSEWLTVIISEEYIHGMKDELRAKERLAKRYEVGEQRKHYNISI